MHMPHATVSPQTLLNDYGEYLLARLEAKKELQDLAEAFAGQQDDLRKKVETASVLERGIQHALAARDDADFGLDDAVRQFSLAILSANRGNRKSPAYVKYFPEGLLAVTMAPLAQEVVAVSNILDLLSAESDAQLKGYQELLQGNLDVLRKAVAAHKAAMDGADSAGNAVRAQAITWRDTYRKVYGELTARHASERAYVESFFKKPPGASRKAARPAEPPGAMAADGGEPYRDKK